MAFTHKPGSFSLFKNDKQGNEARTDYTGSGMDLEGKLIYVSAWIKKGEKGSFMSCNFKYQDDKPKAKKHDSGSPADMDDVLPF